MPTRIDLSGMPGPRTRGETTRFDLAELLAALEPQTVNRAGKRDREDVVEVPGLPRGMMREALGQAMLLGYGDDIEGYLAGRNPDDIRRERNAFADENRLAANAAYVGGIAAGGLAPRVVRALSGAGRAADDLEDVAAPRMEPDLRQAMRNADQVETAQRPADMQRDALERLLSSPEARADVRGQPMELSPADIFTMTAGAPIAGEQTGPGLSSEEEALRAMSPTDALRFGLENQVSVDDATRAQNLRRTAEDALSVIPGPANVLSARDAFQGAEDAGEAFGAGDWRGGIMNSALAALGGVGAVTGLPTSRAAGRAAREGGRTAGVFVPVEEGMLSERARELRDTGASNRDVLEATGMLFGADGSMRRWIPDQRMDIDFSFKPGDVTTVGNLVDHPTLFREMPQLQNRIVSVTDKLQPHSSRGISRTDPETGNFEFSSAGDMPHSDMAKLLQYDINDAAGWSSAGRHDFQGQLSDVLTAQLGAARHGQGNLPAATAYVDALNVPKRQVEAGIAQRDRFKDMGRRLTDQAAGSVDSKIVRALANSRADAPFTYPYGPGASWVKGNYAVPNFKDMMVLPPKGIQPDDWEQFLGDWYRYGAGRGD